MNITDWVWLLIILSIMDALVGLALGFTRMRGYGAVLAYVWDMFKYTILPITSMLLFTSALGSHEPAEQNNLAVAGIAVLIASAVIQLVVVIPLIRRERYTRREAKRAKAAYYR
jgi:uncharacterized membrane protein